MPIDSSVVSGIRPLQLPDLAKQYSDTQGLIQQRQLHNQQIEQNALELAEKKKAVAASDALTGLLKQNTSVGDDGTLTTNHGAIMKGLADSGFGPAALKYDVQRRAELKSALETQEQQTKTNAAKAERLGSLAGSIPRVDWTAPDAQQRSLQSRAALKRAMDTAIAEKLIDPAHAQELEAQEYTPDLEAQVQQFGAEAMKAKEQHDSHISDLGEIRAASVEDRAKKEDKRKDELHPVALAKATADATEAGLKADFTQQQQDASALAAAAAKGPQAVAEAMMQLDPKRAKPFLNMSPTAKPEEFLKVGQTPNEQVSAENNVTDVKLRMRAAGGDEKAKKALADEEASKIRVAKVEAQNKWDLQMGALTQAANGEPGAGVKMVADYQMPLNQLLSRTPPAARAMILDQIKKLNPDFLESQYGVAQKTEQDSVTGDIGKTSNAQNTALSHLGVLHDAASALKNGNIQLINKVANAIGAQTGSSAKTTYDAIVHKVGPELTNAYVKGGGSVGERGANEKDYSSSMAPQQILDNIGIAATLLEGKIKANQSQYDRGTYGRGKQKLLTDEAASTLKRLSGGGTPTVTTKAQYDALASGATYTGEDGKKYKKP